MSTYSDDYRELIESARDAVYKLLRGSTPDSLMGLRGSYSELRRDLERDDEERSKAGAHREASSTLDERRELERIWDDAPRARRESLLFTALRDERLTIREATARLNIALDAPEGSHIVYETSARSLIMRMFREGHPERAAEQFQGKTRYRYFRKITLDGPIVDLERAYHHDDAEGGES